MRTLLKISMPVESANRAMKDGSMQRVLQSVLDALRPEAAYFYTEGGKRTAFVVFDLKETSQIPVVAEPLFVNFNAAVDFSPVMNLDELKSGIEKSAKQSARVPAAA